MPSARETCVLPVPLLPRAMISRAHQFENERLVERRNGGEVERINEACARRPGIRKTVAGGGAARSRAFSSEPSRCRDMLFRKIHGGMDIRRPIIAYRTNAICAVSLMSA
jgi:hypothetical protein